MLPFVADERKALHAGRTAGPLEGNLSEDAYARGDVGKGFAAADVVLEETYRTACELHTPMEPHGCVANWDGRSLTLWESTQGVYAVQSRVAEVLGLPLSRVRVIGHYMGGGFGSKLEAGKYTVIAALLARRAGPPGAFVPHAGGDLPHGRQPAAQPHDLKAGVKKDGTLTALDFTVLGTGGAYTAGGTSLVDWLVRDLYTCPNVRTNSTDVYINAGPARRLPGARASAGRLGAGADDGRPGPGHRHGPGGAAAEEHPLLQPGARGQPALHDHGLQGMPERGAAAFGWEEARREPARKTCKGTSGAGSVWPAGSGLPAGAGRLPP